MKDNFFTYYHNPQDTNSIGSDDIWRVYADRSGRVWIGTQAGLDRFEQKTNHFIHYRLNPFAPGLNTDPAVLAIYQDRQEILWIGTREGGLFRLDPETGLSKNYLHNPLIPNSLSHNTVSSIVEDTSGNLWIGTGFFTEGDGSGLNRFDRISESFHVYRHDPRNPNSLSHNNIGALHMDQHGYLWIGTLGGGLNRFDPLSGQFHHFKSDLQNPQSIGGNMIMDFAQDQAGNLWLAIRDYGIDRFSMHSNISRYWPVQKIYAEGSKYDMVGALIKDNDGTIWGGLGMTGIFKLNPVSGGLQFYGSDRNDSNSISGALVMSLRTDQAGNIWIGTDGRGLYRFNPGSNVFTRFRHNPADPNSLSNDLVHALHVDRSGTLWIGTAYGGLNKFNPGTETFTHYWNDPKDPNSISDNHVFAILEDRSGELWIGTFKGGLNRFDRLNQKFIRYQHNPADFFSLLSNNVNRIYEDKAGTLWFGSMEGGVSWLKKEEREGGRFYHLTVKDGLPSFFITGFFEDHHDNLWITTNNGLCRYSLKDKKIENFFESDGLPFSTLLSALETRSGDVYIGGMGGVFCFNPDQWQINMHQPPLIFTAFSVFNQPYPLDTTITEKKKITLSYRENMFSIHFAALDYLDPERNEYMYKMEGFHQDWIYSGTGRMATFTDLDPGSYTFRVKGSNNNGIWNETGASIQIHITPPWWRTGPAYLFYGLAVIGFLFLLFRYQVRRHQVRIEGLLKAEQEQRRSEAAEHRAVESELQVKTAEALKEVEKEQMRSRIASDLHDDIGGNLSSISMISQMLEKKKVLGREEKKWLKDINKIARMTAESMRDIIWFVNPENDDLDKLLVKMRQTANLMLENIDFTYTVPDCGTAVKTDIHFRRNLFLMYKEILQNIIKHARATEVVISISNTNGIFEIQVKDNGTGFDTAQTTQGNGLKNLSCRAGEIRGDLNIDSRPGCGTLVRFTVKNTVITV